MIITTDDMCPAYIGLWEQYWDKLKEEFPGLKVTAFVVPKYLNQEKFRVDKHKEFRQWFEDRKDWVIIAMHGFTHEKFEGKMSFQEQLQRYTKGLAMMKGYLPERWGFKPPYYKFNADSLEVVLGELKAAYYMGPYRGFIEPGTSFQVPGLIETHTNDHTDMPDRIDKYYETLRKLQLFKSLNEVVDNAFGRRAK